MILPAMIKQAVFRYRTFHKLIKCKNITAKSSLYILNSLIIIKVKSFLCFLLKNFNNRHTAAGILGCCHFKSLYFCLLDTKLTVFRILFVNFFFKQKWKKGAIKYRGSV